VVLSARRTATPSRPALTSLLPGPTIARRDPILPVAEAAIFLTAPPPWDSLHLPDTLHPLPTHPRPPTLLHLPIQPFPPILRILTPQLLPTLLVLPTHPLTPLLQLIPPILPTPPTTHRPPIPLTPRPPTAKLPRHLPIILRPALTVGRAGITV